MIARLSFILLFLTAIFSSPTDSLIFRVTPEVDTAFGCLDDTVTVFVVTGGFVLDPDSLLVEIDGEVHDTSWDGISIGPMGITFDLDLTPYDGSDEIPICLRNIADRADIHYVDSFCWQYFTDYDDEPPTLEFIDYRGYGIAYPGDTVVLKSWNAYLVQDFSGIDTGLTVVTVEGHIIDHSYSYYMFRSDTLGFRFDFRNGLHIPEGDTMIDICIHVEDNAPCPNVLDTCYQIYYAPRDYCQCRAGIYMARWRSISSLVHTPITLVIDSLAVKYEYFGLDSEPDVFNPDSYDVYYVIPSHYGIPDSSAEKIQEFVYNGGILYMWLERAYILTGTHALLQSHDDWLWGLEPRNTDVAEDPEIWTFDEHPVIPDIDTIADSLTLDRAGSLRVSGLARRLFYVESYSRHGSEIEDYNPITLGMSHYGRGTVFLHMDYTAIRWGLDYSTAAHHPNPLNMSINYDLPCCSHIPRFSHYPQMGRVFHCQEETLSITTEIDNFGDIAPDSLYVMWNDSIYDMSSVLLDAYDATIVFNIPPDTYHDGDTLFLCLRNIIDTGGYWTYDSICWSYYFEIDDDPPELVILSPEAGDTLSELGTFSFTLNDSNNIDSTSLLITFEEDWEYTIESPAIYHYSDTFFFDPMLAGFDFGEVDSFLDICVHAHDANQDCTPQPLDTCWSVYLNASAIDERIPTNITLSVSPNPFNSSCFIDGPEGDRADIYDQNGRLVRSLVLPVVWDGSDSDGKMVGSGGYIVKTDGERVDVKYVK